MASELALVSPLPDRDQLVLQRADIFFTRGTGILSRLIRFFSRGIGEARTKVNHVGVVVEAGPIEKAVVIEALSRVKRHRLADQYGGTSHEVAVYRPLNASQDDVRVIVAAAENYEGLEYGYFKIVLHVLDWVLLGAYLFRRLAGDRYPICSWLVAHSYKKAGLFLGVEAGEAQPDDIWDFALQNPGRYRQVRPLQLL